MGAYQNVSVVSGFGPRAGEKLRRLAINYRIVAASPLFDAQWYLNANPDVAAAKIDPSSTTS